MGTNVSSTVNRNISTAVSKQAVTAQQTIINQNFQDTKVTQSVEIIIEPEAKLSCGNLEINQEAKVNYRSLSAATGDQKINMSQLIAQALATEAKTALDQQNKDLSFLQTNVANTINEAIANTYSEQQVAIEQTFENTITQTTEITQTVKLLVGSKAEVFVAGTCTFNQQSSIEYSAELMTTAAIDVVLDDQNVQDVMSQWDTAISQLNKGLSLGAIIGIVVAVIVLIIILAVVGKFVIAPYIAKKNAAKTSV